MRKKALLVIAACMLLCMVAGAFTGCQAQENAAPQQEGTAPAGQEQSVDSAGTGGDGGASVSEGPDERSFTDSSGSVVRLDEGLLLPEGMTAAEYAERRLAHKGFGVEADGKGNEYQVRFLTVYLSEGRGGVVPLRALRQGRGPGRALLHGDGNDVCLDCHRRGIG